MANVDIQFKKKESHSWEACQKKIKLLQNKLQMEKEMRKNLEYAIDEITEHLFSSLEELTIHAEQLQKRNKELEFQDKIVKIINQEISLKNVLKTLLHQALFLFPQGVKGVFLQYDSLSNQFRVAAVEGYDISLIKKRTLSFEYIMALIKNNVQKLDEGLFVIQSFNFNERIVDSDHATKSKPKVAIALSFDKKTKDILILNTLNDFQNFEQPDIQNLLRFREHAILVLSKAKIFELLQAEKKEKEKALKTTQMANEELEDAQAEQGRLITILESTSDIIMTVLPDATVTYINNAGKKMTGWLPNEDFSLKKISDLHPKWALDKIRREGIPNAIANKIWEGETAIVGADDREIPVSQVIMAHILPNGKLEYLSTIMRDITDRKQDREKLIEAKNYIDDIINSMPSVLVGVDNECRITQYNMQAEKITNTKAKDAIGKEITEIFPKMTSQKDKIIKAIKTGEIQFNPKQSQNKNGKIIFEDVTIYPLIASDLKGAVIRIDNVTDKVGMEEMIIQSEKMLSVGGLAAGMAHEINNPLAGIMQNTDLILKRIHKDMPANNRAAEEAGITMEEIRSFLMKRKITQHLEMIHKAGAQAAQIVQNMLSFARPDRSGKSKQDLIELFNQTVVLAANDYDLKNKYDFKQIEIIREYESNIPNVPCEASKIQQVFLNILKNGSQAMHENGTEKPKFILRVSKEDNMVRVEIQDNGPGMRDEIRKHVFEPFYTTKDVGVGTGLGLSISYFIIKENHGGIIEVESLPEQGTKFIIKLPTEQ